FETLRRQAEQQAALSPAAAAAADTARPEAAPGPDSFPPAERGTPAYWSADRNEPPQITLVAVSTRDDAWTRHHAWIFLGLLAGLVFIAISPRMADILRALWPEEMLLLGCIGWALFGPRWVFAFLVLLGIFGRLLHVAGWLGSFRLTRVAAPPS